MNDAQKETVRFAEIALGVQVSDTPPPPGSKLAQLIELQEKGTGGRGAGTDPTPWTLEEIRANVISNREQNPPPPLTDSTIVKLRALFT
jgi:hypothetical protein